MSEYESELSAEITPGLKDYTRAKRRKKSIAKARRKQNISRRIYHTDWYDNLHQYADNKIHCSCHLCRSKTSRTKLQITGKGGKNWCLMDLKRVQEMNGQIEEY